MTSPAAGDSVRVLHVGDRSEVSRELQRRVEPLEITGTDDAERGLQTVAEGAVDCVVVEAGAVDGAAFLARVRDSDSLVPVVYVGDEWDDDTAAAVVEHGGSDYVTLDDGAGRDLLARRVRETVENYHARRSRDESDPRLQTAKTRFERLFEHSRDCIAFTWYVNGEPIVRRVNPAFEEVFGYSEDEIVGANLNELIVPDGGMDHARDLDERALDDTWIEHELRRETAGGELRDFLFRGTQITTATGLVEGYPIYTDITDLKERERTLRRQNERLDEFASIVAHDLRSPLDAAAGQLRLVREEVDRPELDAVGHSHDRMASLIDDLLTLTRSVETESDPEPVDLEAFVDGCWRTIQTGEARLIVDTDSVVQADRTLLRELVENLLRNAVEHGSTDSRNAERSGEADEDATDRRGGAATVTVGDLPDGFYVEDDGSGIPESEREEVFELGYSTTTTGTGLGLHIVERMAESHGWDVTVDESDAGGARVEITGVETGESASER